MMIDDHTYLPSPPLAALRRELPRAKIAFDAGTDPASAAALAGKRRRRNRLRHPAQQRRVGWQASSWPTIRTPRSPRSPGPIPGRSSSPKPAARSTCRGSTMCPAILEAFYPGIRGGPAIARILTGKVNPSGHCRSPSRPRPTSSPDPDIAGLGEPDGTPAQITYDEGAAIGYKWYDVKGYKPLFCVRPWAQLHQLRARRTWRRSPTARPSRSASQFATPASARARASAQVYVAPADWTKGRLGSAQTARRLRQGRTEARPDQAHRGDGRSAPARDL